MPKSNILKALEELNKPDYYSLMFFVLYKLKDVSEYSLLSELVYLLDGDSFARFMSYFEGQTIKVPKLEELKDITNTLLFYERKMNSNLSEEEIYKELNISKKDQAKIETILDLVSKILKEYNFKRDGNYESL